PSSRSVGIPPELDQLVLRCMAKDPSQRFSSASELAMAIGALLGSSPNLAAVVPGRDSGPYPAMRPTTLSSATGAVATGAPRKRSRAIVFAGVGIAAAVGGVVVVAATRGGS